MYNNSNICINIINIIIHELNPLMSYGRVPLACATLRSNIVNFSLLSLHFTLHTATPCIASLPKADRTYIFIYII